jgi:hypothetical protein
MVMLRPSPAEKALVGDSTLTPNEGGRYVQLVFQGLRAFGFLLFLMLTACCIV